MATHVVKVTTAGQITLPKELRDRLGMSEDSYLELAKVGDIIVVKKITEDEDFLKRLREKVKKSGVTRAQVNRWVEEARKKSGEKYRAKTLR